MSSTIGEQLHAARLREGLTQSKVAEETGCTRSAVGRMERLGDTVPTGRVSEFLPEVARYLGVDLSPYYAERPTRRRVNGHAQADTQAPATPPATRMSDGEFVDWLVDHASRRHLVTALAKLIYEESPSGDDPLPFSADDFAIRGVPDGESHDEQSGESDIS